MTARARAAFAVVLAMIAGSAHAQPAPLALLAPPPGDDARKAIALGPHGEVYAPDGSGAWVRTHRFTTVDKLTVVGRAGGVVVAAGDGAVYKLAPNGWSAIRLHQKDKAIMAGGPRAVAVVKRQLYALDRTKAGEPEKLALAPANVTAIGGGKSIVIAMASGLARVERGKVAKIAGAPRQVVRLIDDRWAIVATGAHDLKVNKTIPWPAGAKVTAIAAGPDGSVIAVAAIAGKLALLTIGSKPGSKLDRQAIDLTTGAATGTAVGIAIDRAGRAVVALADGRILVRERGAWSETTVKEELPAARSGPAPARSP